MKRRKIEFNFVDIKEIIEIEVPVGMTDEEEKKYIDEKMEDYKFTYGY